MYRWADGHMDGHIGHTPTQADGHTYNFIILIVLLRFVTAFAALRRCKNTRGYQKCHKIYNWFCKIFKNAAFN
jgi:hypothetical protein